MERKPDILRALVLIFAVGLVVTGFTSLQASEDSRSSGIGIVAGGAAPEDPLSPPRDENKR